MFRCDGEDVSRITRGATSSSGYIDLTCRGIPYIGNMSAQCTLSNTDIIKTKSLDFQIFLFVGLFFGLVTNFMAADFDADVGHTLFNKYALIQKINCEFMYTIVLHPHRLTCQHIFLS